MLTYKYINEKQGYQLYNNHILLSEVCFETVIILSNKGLAVVHEKDSKYHNIIKEDGTYMLYNQITYFHNIGDYFIYRDITGKFGIMDFQFNIVKHSIYDKIHYSYVLQRFECELSNNKYFIYLKDIKSTNVKFIKYTGIEVLDIIDDILN